MRRHPSRGRATEGRKDGGTLRRTNERANADGGEVARERIGKWGRKEGGRESRVRHRARGGGTQFKGRNRPGKNECDLRSIINSQAISEDAERGRDRRDRALFVSSCCFLCLSMCPRRQ